MEEVRYKLGNLKMGADQNPSILLCQLATLEHAYAHTKGMIAEVAGLMILSISYAQMKHRCKNTAKSM